MWTDEDTTMSLQLVHKPTEMSEQETPTRRHHGSRAPSITAAPTAAVVERYGTGVCQDEPVDGNALRFFATFFLQ